jgi:hypothetical protein
MRKLPLFFVLSASAAVVFSVACGGQETPKTPQGGELGGGGAGAGASSGSGSGGEATAGGEGSGSGDTAGNGGTTTTTQLDASDLQGAKLSSSSRKEIETKGEGGPKAGPGGRSDEPGRRREDIATIVQAHRDEARACYDKGLKDHPGIEGDLDVKWTIDPQGVVTDVAVDPSKSQIHEESVGSCVVEVIKKLKFNASAKGFETRAHYPFNFHPRNNPGSKKKP